jgi:hypothetical protein
VTVTIYASEADAQAIGARLRKREPLGASLAVLRRIYSQAIGTALGARRGRVRIKFEAEAEAEGGLEMEDLVRGSFGGASFGGGSFGGAFGPARGFGGGRPIFAMRRPLLMRRRAWRRGFGWRRRPPRYRRRLLVYWIARSLAAELDRSREAFIQAVDAPADGVTIVLRMNPPALRALLATGLPMAALAGGPGQVQVEIKPGQPGG